MAAKKQAHSPLSLRQSQLERLFSQLRFQFQFKQSPRARTCISELPPVFPQDLQSAGASTDSQMSSSKLDFVLQEVHSETLVVPWPSFLTGLAARD